MNLDRWISVFTMAGIIGLFILNPDGFSKVIGAAGSTVTSYVKTVQGR